MSLILGVSKGEKIFLGEVVMDVIDTSDDMRNMTVAIGDNTFDLNDTSFIEVYPTVFAAVGKPRYETFETLTRIAIDAPRSMKILRSSNKHYARNH
jgi:sRNA-binding carbon storage regulator CsrA